MFKTTLGLKVADYAQWSLQFPLQGKKRGSQLSSDSWAAIVVRFAHAPKIDHTPNVQTLNFNFYLYASVQTMSLPG